ncbi:MAG: CusA/CzcA family heavy metal efflux RND transporter [Deltaproteobacteria bacterium]|nr:CusA/CzcA family heavy metal efflux RND transporter [Deltaproteobacteria bacterium]
MFGRLARFAVERRWLVLAAVVIFTFFGVQSFRQLPIEAFPDVTDPMVEVVGLYPGQSAEEVERRVTLELERVLAGTPRLADLRSVSVFGLSLITLTFEEGTPDFQLRTLVAERLRDASLPDTAEAVMGPQATPVGQIFRYTLRGARSLRELRAIQDFVVERRLRSVPGVADVVTFGGFQRQYQVRIDPARLAATGVTASEVYEVVARANANAGGGYVGVGSQEFVVRGLGSVQTPAELGEAVVRSVGGVPIRVKDVADLVEGSTPRRGSVGRGREAEVVEGIVLLRRGENPSVVLEALSARVAQINHEVLPRGVEISTFYDRRALVDATLRTVATNMAEGVLLLIVVLYLFLRTVRGVLIIAMVIPLSLLTAFVGLRAMGLPANLISLGAIDFGIIVDGAVIVLEATLHMLHKPRAPGATKASIVEAATASVARPVTFAMLIIVAALAPIFSLERTEGKIFAPMAFTYAFALLGALVCATLVVPAMEAIALPEHLHDEDPRWFVMLRGVYAWALGRVLRLRVGVLLAATALLLATIPYVRGIGNEFLPELNEGGLYITATFPSSISLDETVRQVALIRARALRVPEVTDVLSHVGRPESATQAEGPNNAEFFIPLMSERAWRRGVTRRSIEESLRASLREIPGVQYNFSQPITDRVFETISGIIGQVVVKVHGEDLNAMMRVAEQVRGNLGHVQGVTDLAIYMAGDSPQLQITLDRPALARRGLSVGDVQRAIEIALGGAVATEVWQGERRFDVALRLPESVRASADALGRLVVGDAEHRATLGEVARIEFSRGRAAIWREDFSRFVAIKFNVRGRDLGSTVAAGQRAMRALSLPDGVWLTWGGEFQNQRRAMRRLSLSLPFALLAIVGILYVNFRRWRPTLSIVAFLPFAVLGGVAGLRLMGENFSVSSAVGCIALLGQVVLGGVLVCTRIDEARDRGDADAAVSGALEAFRPVLLTTSLALLGLVPAALSHAMGSETQRPFAIAIIAGLLAGIPAVLLLLPAAYAPTRRTDDKLAPAPGAA